MNDLAYWKGGSMSRLSIDYPFVEVEPDEEGFWATVGYYGFVDDNDDISDLSQFLTDLWTENDVDTTCKRYGYPVDMIDCDVLSGESYEEAKRKLADWIAEARKRKTFYS